MAIPAHIWNKHFPESNAVVPEPQYAIGEEVYLKLCPERRFIVIRNYIAYEQPTSAGERWLELSSCDRPAFWKENQLQRV
ncbi:hypothetical protein C1752_10444 [Acaryochloris thomasi RCC1774]|uniref:Uncharacterized protein n=1 Tax=Acaryochloris thomasi RCC1774 TaxID=1764569 RepID=A0A2W1JK07_9CYAN|nr:hypothetical protein [Acaryochloris thomasi]PZD70594.1 hypothetical protein C1752_10444 [Acaryochloris thomasi RCC1774]